ncbi:MAG: hypothetical protein AAF721_08480 [Myxococcota bacterium]
MRSLIPIAGALAICLLPAVVRADPAEVDPAAANDALTRMLGEEVSHWTLSVAAVEDDPAQVRVIVMSDLGDEAERTITLGQTPPERRAAAVADVAFGMIRELRAGRSREEEAKRRQALELAARRQREAEARRIEAERLRRQSHPPPPAKPPDRISRRVEKGFIGIASRASIGAGRGAVEASWGVRGGFWFADEHLLALGQGFFSFNGDGDYLKLYGGRVGAGVYAGAPLAKGILWLGGGMTPHVRWDQSPQAPVRHAVGFDTEVSGVLMVRGPGHLGVRMGVEIADPRTIVEYGDVGVDRGAVRFMFGITFGASLPPRRKK